MVQLVLSCVLLLLSTSVHADFITLHMLDGDDCFEVKLDKNDIEYAESFVEDLHDGTCSDSGFALPVQGGSFPLHIPFVKVPLTFSRNKKSMWNEGTLMAKNFLSAPFLLFRSSRNSLQQPARNPARFSGEGNFEKDQGGFLQGLFSRFANKEREAPAKEVSQEREAPAKDVEPSGYYAKFPPGICSEQALLAFKGEVAEKSSRGWSIATFAGGCFWGPQLLFDRVEGVMGTSVGYTQGKINAPSYTRVCSGRTGHTEAVQVFYDESKVCYSKLLDTFWNSIDPTIKNGQGGDRGTQYRTGIYCHTDAQQKAAEASLAEQQQKYKRPIATEIKKATVYWPAEFYHQNYLRNGGRWGDAQSAAKGCTDKIRCYG